MTASDRAVRRTTPEDLPALATLYEAAFPEKDLVPLLRQLLAVSEQVLSLAHIENGRPAGHAAFTDCSVDPGGAPAALVGPVAVLPERQKTGIGSALIRSGIRHLETEGTAHFLVLGDPAYYTRLGFRPDRSIAPPYPLPEAWRDAWQRLDAGDAPQSTGRLAVPLPWRDPALRSE